MSKFIDHPQLIKMKPDFLIDRKQVMTILEMRNPNKFKQLWSDGLLPAPLGADGTSYLWSGTVIRQVKQMMDSGVQITEDLIMDISLEALVRLVENKSMKMI